MQKFVKLIGLLALLTFSVAGMAQDTTEVVQPPAISVVDTLGVAQIGDSLYYVVAENLNGVYTNVRTVIAQVKQDPPKSTMDWIGFLLQLIVSGAFASVIAQTIKIAEDLKRIVGHLPRGEWIVLVVSTVIGGIWLYIETRFEPFDFMVLFARIASVYLVAQLLWRGFLSKLLSKQPNAPNPQP